MNAIIDFSKIQEKAVMDDYLDTALLHCYGASALLTVFQNSIDSLIIGNAEKISMVDAVVSLLDDARSGLKSVTTIDLKSVFARIDQVTVALSCLRRSFNNESDCPNDRVQVEAVNALVYLLNQALASLNDAGKGGAA